MGGVGQQIHKDVPGQTILYKNGIVRFIDYSATFGLLNTDTSLLHRSINDEPSLFTPSQDLITTVASRELDRTELNVGLFGQNAATAVKKNNYALSVGGRRFGDIKKLKGVIKEFESVDQGWRGNIYANRKTDNIVVALDIDLFRKRAAFTNLFGMDEYNAHHTSSSVDIMAKKHAINGEEVSIGFNTQRGSGREETISGERMSRRIRHINTSTVSLNVKKDNLHANISYQHMNRSGGSQEDNRSINQSVWQAVISYEKTIKNTTLNPEIGVQNSTINALLTLKHGGDAGVVQTSIARFSDVRTPYIFDSQLIKEIQEDLEHKTFQLDAKYTTKKNPSIIFESRYLKVNRYTKLELIETTNLEGFVFRGGVQGEARIGSTFLDYNINATRRFMTESSEGNFPDGSVPQSPKYQIGANLSIAQGPNNIDFNLQYQAGNRFVLRNQDKHISSELYLSLGFHRKLSENIGVYFNIQNFIPDAFDNTPGVAVSKRIEQSFESGTKKIPKLTKIDSFPNAQIGISFYW